MKEYTKKEASLLQEEAIAKLVGGKRVAGSGNGAFNGGDVLTDNWFFECKTVISNKDSYNVKKSVLEKAKEQCFEQRRDYYSLAFRFSPEGKDYFVVDNDTFKYMMNCVNYCDKNEINVYGG